MENKFEYIINNFEKFYDVKLSDFDISYGENSTSRIYIEKSELINIFIKKEDVNPEKVIFKTWKKKNIPFILDYHENEIFTETQNQVKINFDIIGAAFYLLSGWDEFISEKRDKLGRHLFSESIQFKLGIIELPVVNYYYDILKTAIEKTYNISIKYRLQNPALCLTHDVDSCNTAWTEARVYEQKNKKYFNAVKLVFKHIFFKDDWFNFDKIIKLEKSLNAKSTFFFLPQKGKTKNGYKNADYNISSKKIQKAIKKIKQAGCKIGVHSAFNTHLNSNEFNIDLLKFTEKPIGNRFHFLMYDNPKTIKVLEQNNIKYDTTLGYSEHIGFRNSTTYPFYIYDLQNDKSSNVLEIPLNIMDATFFYKKYMGIEKQDVLNKIESLLSETQKFNGVLTILWHNNYFSDYKFKGWGKVYIEILKKSKNSDFELINAENLLTRFCY